MRITFVRLSEHGKFKPLFDYYVNPFTKEFDLWNNLISNEYLINQFIKIDNIDVINNEMMEPLYKEKVIILFIISNLINNNKSLFLNYLHFSKNSHIINNFINDEKYKTLIYNINPKTKPSSLINYFNKSLYNIHRNIYGDKYGKKVAIFIDDIHLNSSIDEMFITLGKNGFLKSKL